MSVLAGAVRPRLPKQGMVRCLAVGTAGITIDPNGIKTSIATVAADVIYYGYHLDGATKVVSGADYGFSPTPQVVWITSTADAHCTAVDVVVTGEDEDGDAVVETIPITAGGGVIDKGLVVFYKVYSIAIPAQGGTDGALEFGFADDDNGIIESIATVAGTGVEYTDTDFDGAAASSDDYALAEPPRNFAITSGDHADHDAVAVVVIGTDYLDRTQVETITTTANGNVTDQGVKLFKTVTEVRIPAQTGTNGTWELGFGSIASLEEFKGNLVDIVADSAWSVSCEVPGVAITQPVQATTGDTEANDRCMVYPETIVEVFEAEPDRLAFKAVTAADSKVLRFSRG